MERERITGCRLHGGGKLLIQLVLTTLMMLSSVLALPAFVRAECRLPEGIPDLASPASQGNWEPYVLGSLGGNPNFPLVLYLNKVAGGPPGVMMVIDARNGKQTWSLTSDPAIVVVVLANLRTVKGLYYDQGFVEAGHASGQYANIAHPDLASLPALLERVLEVQHRVYM